MTEYKLEPRFFSTLRRRTSLLGLPLILLSLGLGFYVSARNDTRPLPWFLWAGIILIGLIAGSIGWLWGLRRAMRSWSSFRIVLDEDGVTQVRDRGKIRILYSEITRIYIGRDGLSIRTADRFRFIAVSRMIERFDEIRAALAQRHAIDEVPRSKAARNIALLIAEIAVLLAMVVAFYVSTNRIVIVAASTGFLLLAVYMIVLRRKGLGTYLSPFLF